MICRYLDDGMDLSLPLLWRGAKRAWHSWPTGNRPVREQSRRDFAPAVPKTGAGDASVRANANAATFDSVHASVLNHFNAECALYSRQNFKAYRAVALAEWRGLLAA